MFRSKGELDSCARLVFRFLCERRVGSPAGDGHEGAHLLSEEEARRGYYILFGTVAPPESASRCHSAGLDMDEDAFALLAVSGAHEHGLDWECGQHGARLDPVEPILFESLAGKKGFITRADLVDAVSHNTLFCASRSTLHTAPQGVPPEPTTQRRDRFISLLFQKLDCDQDGRLLFRDVKRILGTPQGRA